MSELRCLFCRAPLSEKPGERNREHIVPRSLGGAGWLTTYSLCRSCNSVLGNDVDKVADNPLLVVLRAEAGLSPHYRPWREYTDPISGAVVRRRIGFDGSPEPAERVYERDGQVTVVAPTIARAQAMADTFAERRRRKGQTVTFGKPYTREGRAEIISLDLNTTRVDELNELLAREAAKIAVEYVAHLSTPEIALSPNLDSLRAGALTGSQLDADQITYWDSDTLYLPRTGQLLTVWGRGPDPPSYEDQIALLRDESGDFHEPPASVPRLTELVHRVVVWRDSEGGWFEFDLFGWFGVRLPLAAELPLPWGRYDFRNFSQQITGEGTR